MKMLLLMLLSFVIVLSSIVIGVFLSIQIDINFVDKPRMISGKYIDYLPEKITKIETDYTGGGGIHFRSDSGKIYRCDFNLLSCAEISKPERISDKPVFKPAEELFLRFSPPNGKIKQIVSNSTMGLMSHYTIRQFALTGDGKVWFWIFSGNDLGKSFPIWHLEHWLTLLVGTIGGLIFGLIISILIWIKFYPRS